VEAASASRGDSGKPGVSGTAVAAGVAAAGAAVAGAVAATSAKRSGEHELSGEQESRSGRESDISGDVVAVGPSSGTASTLQTSPDDGPVGTVPVGGGRALDDDLGSTYDPVGDPIAVDEYGTATAAVSGGSAAIPVEPPTAGGLGSAAEPDPRDRRSGTGDDPDDPQRPV
jgi:hypothetical protein